MWTPEDVVGALRERGELWEAAPGLVGLRGDVLRLHQALGQAIARLAAAETEDEWLVPSGVAFETLARAGYFQSFPQWLTAASHLSTDPGVLEGVATDADPAAAARRALAPADAALSPAVCYHVYARLAGRTIAGGAPEVLTAQGTCWRHEGERLAPLGRGWAFTMREIVCVGPLDAVETFRQRGIERATALAEALGLGGGAVAQASDPFFAPTSRGKALLQQLKVLKEELMLGGMAAASFNNHESFFGDAFGIRLQGGAPAASGCVAFGLERWTLAFLLAHGPDAARWPVVD
jgi:seryl-tRNA synthetase